MRQLATMFAGAIFLGEVITWGGPIGGVLVVGRMLLSRKEIHQWSGYGIS